MHQEVSKALYDMYPMEDKTDFFAAYLYMKYAEHFLHQGVLSLGMPVREPKRKIDEALVEMIKFHIQEIADVGMSRDMNIYHGKLVTTKDASQIVTQKVDLTLPITESVVPFKRARDVIMKNPQSIALGTCPCRMVSENPCLPEPMEVCMFVGEPFASFIAEQNPYYRKTTQEEALHVIETTHKQGCIHSAFFKADMGNRFYAICNCCKCCCLGVKIWNMTGGAYPYFTPSGYVCSVDSNKCNGCGICAEGLCPFNAISLDQEANVAIIDFDKCMGCGVCDTICPSEALVLKPDPAKGVPLDIQALKG